MKRTSRQVIGGVKVRTFPMTHAFPDNFGIAINTDQGYIVYTGEFIVDYDMLQEEYQKDVKFDQWANTGEESLFVKNLENVQGDERDIILFSVAFGPNAEGKIVFKFWTIK